MPLTDAQREWWEKQAARQGRPPQIEDPAMIEAVAAVLRCVDPVKLAEQQAQTEQG